MNKSTKITRRRIAVVRVRAARQHRQSPRARQVQPHAQVRSAHPRVGRLSRMNCGEHHADCSSAVVSYVALDRFGRPNIGDTPVSQHVLSACRSSFPFRWARMSKRIRGGPQSTTSGGDGKRSHPDNGRFLVEQWKRSIINEKLAVKRCRISLQVHPSSLEEISVVTRIGSLRLLRKLRVK